MNVTRITQLFSVQGGVSNAQQTSSAPINAGASTPEPSPSVASDAVRLGDKNSDPVARAAKVASIKAAIDTGHYDYNRPAVATAVYRDLL